MPLFIGHHMYSFSRELFVYANDAELTVYQSDRLAGKFNIEAPIEWLKVSPDGKAILLYGLRGTRIWRWQEGSGVELFLESSGKRDIIGSGFITSNGNVVTMVSREGVLRGLSSTGDEIFSCNLKSPHAFYPRSFVPLSKGRIALTGSFFGDYCDVVVTVGLDDLFRNAEAVQDGIRNKAPVWDRANDITVGPCESDSAVVLRKPEETEMPDDDEDMDYFGDVAAFTGIYIRNLHSRVLEGRFPYKGRAGSGAGIAATREWIAIQVLGGIDMIDRASGDTYPVPEAILDVSGLRVGFVKDYALVKILPIDDVVRSIGSR